jgi:putative polymerase
MYIVTAIVLFFAVLEYFFSEFYLNIFRITQYYVARGTLLEHDPSLQYAKGLMVSGVRPPEQGRGLLSFLGEHRVSSLFLEPISLGNFGSIVVFWGIARSKMEGQLRVWSISVGIALIILSDTRFSAYFLSVGILILIMNPRVTTPIIIISPFIIIFALFVYALQFSMAIADHARDVPIIGGLSMQERLLYSGRVLHYFDIYHWLGITVSRAQTFDAGYAYVISNMGITGLAVFWLLFMSLKGHTNSFYAFRNTYAAYFAVLLCISASAFTIKFAALLWFLIGSLSVARDKEVLPLANGNLELDRLGLNRFGIPKSRRGPQGNPESEPATTRTRTAA